MKVRILAKAGTARWRTLAEQRLEDRRALTLPHQTAGEGDDVRFTLADFPETPPGIRVFVGSVLVASTLSADRVSLIEIDDVGETDAAPLTCRGKFFSDWVGNTRLLVKTRLADADDWSIALILPVAVSAEKITNEEFDRLFAELERESAAVLLDIHGKTQLGLKETAPAALSAPVAILHRIKDAIHDLDGLLRQIGKNPACKLKLSRSRELALAGQAVSEATLAEACSDSRMLIRVAGRVALREHLREHSRPDYRLREHQAIADFSEYLKLQLSDLRLRVDGEMAERQERYRWRSRVGKDGGPTWWEKEDQPRIAELGALRDDIGGLYHRVGKWAALPYLPPGTPLRTLPPITQLFRSHPLYRRVHHAITRHFGSFQTTLDNQPLLASAQSLPVLYEWWCALRVVRILSRGLTPSYQDPLDRAPVASRLASGRKTLTIEFAADRAMTFEDGYGGRVRFRYNPEYRAAREGSRIGLLGGGDLRTPDIAIELFPQGGDPAMPWLIIVLDAKYSSLSQSHKVEEVKSKYSMIGDLVKGTVLSRQVWALTPAAPPGWTRSDNLRGCCTVDNRAFWSDRFEMTNPVNGAVRTRPTLVGEFDPLEALLVSLLVRSGIAYGS